MKDKKIAIEVKNISKCYRIGVKEKVHDTFGRTLLDFIRSPLKNFQKYRSLYKFDDIHSNSSDLIWALKDMSFEVEKGEVLGIIGRNGAGKSTLLKVLSRITTPTTGRIEIYGRVSSLLEVGTGFNPELTGRENVYLNGTILGMKKKEIDSKFDEIVDFSGVEKFIYTPVKRYSSGMRVRLAFAVAAYLEPEILIIDEVLAVGDVEFQKKCLGKMEDIAKKGRTVLFVSHNMAAVENLCDRIILMDSGKVGYQGNTSEVINYYLKTVLPSTIANDPLYERKNRSGDGKIRLTSFHIEDAEGNKLTALRTGIEAFFVFGFQCRDGENPKNVDIGFGINSSNNQRLFVLYCSYVGQNFESVPSSGFFRCCISRFALTPGTYRVSARVLVEGQEADYPEGGVGYIDVEPGDFYGTGHKGIGPSVSFLVSGKWDMKDHISTEYLCGKQSCCQKEL
jgi:lipopolysaccharide transport system ATP-binding protein